MEVRGRWWADSRARWAAAVVDCMRKTFFRWAELYVLGAIGFKHAHQDDVGRERRLRRAEAEVVEPVGSQVPEDGSRRLLEQASGHRVHGRCADRARADEA
eukprot:1405103-Pyramimonas_sp.AAC.1